MEENSVTVVKYAEYFNNEKCTCSHCNIKGSKSSMQVFFSQFPKEQRTHAHRQIHKTKAEFLGRNQQKLVLSVPKKPNKREVNHENLF